MREKGLKGGLLLLAFVLIISKHLTESKFYRIDAKGELEDLVLYMDLDTTRYLTADEYNLIVSGLSSKWLNLVLSNTQISYKAFSINRISFWENLLLLISLALIIFNLKMRVGGRIFPILFIVSGITFLVGQMSVRFVDSERNIVSRARTYTESVRKDLSYQLNEISSRVNDHENRIDEIEYDVERLSKWAW